MNTIGAKQLKIQYFTYQKAICQSVADKEKRQLEQERAKKTKKAKNTEKRNY